MYSRQQRKKWDIDKKEPRLLTWAGKRLVTKRFSNSFKAENLLCSSKTDLRHQFQENFEGKRLNTTGSG